MSSPQTFVIALCETFLSDDISDSEIYMKGFSLARSDRISRFGGGVCMYIRDGLLFKVLLSYSSSVCEVLVVHLTSANLVVILIYRPCQHCHFTDIVEKVRGVLSKFNAPLPHIILLGDLNFPGVDWDFPKS